MGPQLFSCGNASRPQQWALWCRQLQWGRSFSAAEMHDHRIYRRVLSAQLQWGRSFSAAEMTTPTSTSGLVFALQWGRSFSAAEMGEHLKAMCEHK